MLVLVCAGLVFALPRQAAAQANPNAVVSYKSTSTWHNTNTFRVYSTFSGASYYRYVRDTSATHAWTHTETQWNSGTPTLTFTIPAQELSYLHIMAYDAGNNPGTDVHLPFGYDTSSPTVSGFQSISSTGGALGEGQFNDLAAGVTVQITVQDVLSGLLVTTAAVPGDTPHFPGGYSAVYSNDAGRSWNSLYAAYILHPGTYTVIYSLVEYKGKLYAGVGGSSGGGDVMVYDGSAWQVSYDGAYTSFNSLAVYNGKLYAGQGQGTGYGDVYVFDGTSWSLSYNSTMDIVNALAVYNGKLYAGFGDDANEGDVYSYDGTSWAISYNGAQEYIAALAVYNNKLYAGQGSGTGDGDVLVYDGSSWSSSYDGAQEMIRSLAVYGGKLYAGQGISSGDGDVMVFNGSAWSTSLDWDQEYIYSLAVYGGKLYAGLGSGTGDGDIMAFDGASWGPVYGTTSSLVYSMGAYNGRLLAGISGGDILGLAPVAVSTMTGADGATDAQTLSAVIGLKASTNTETCAGISPCGATNQVKFITSDRAGNSYMAGPYAVILSTTPSAQDVVSWKSTGAWYQTSSFTFYSSSGLAAYYRYAWDASPSHSWTYAEPQFTAGVISLAGAAGAAGNYLHLLPYNLAGEYGTARDIGPFYLDDSSPSASAFGSYTSTGGFVSESQINGLLSGVTVQITVQDLLSGLLLSTASVPAELQAGPGGFGLMYSVDSGLNWITHASTVSFDGANSGIYSLAAYGGKLYAGQGSASGAGDVYVFDGATWQLSYDGTQEIIYSLAVHEGKLYAGQGSGSGDGDVLVYNGSSWGTSLDTSSAYIYALASSNGKLYAGAGTPGAVYVLEGSSWTLIYDYNAAIYDIAVHNGRLYAAAASSITVFDGSNWAVSYYAGANTVRKLAVYNGRLYAAVDGAVGNGDILAYDGNSWGVSYDGQRSAFRALAVYEGRLYAGQGTSAGDGDVFSFNGSTWTRVFDSERAYINALAPYDGRLYAGQGNSAGEGDVVGLSNLAVSTMTGADGTTAPQVISGIVDLQLSRTADVCGGAAPCAARNQVVFTATDKAGNVRTAGPYAVLVSAPPSAADVRPLKSTSPWSWNSSFGFVSNFGSAAYFRYLLDNSPSHDWIGAESQWLPGPLSLTAPAEGSSWYFHVVPYEITDSSGVDRHIGPFRFDATPPEAAAFRSYSSTGGLTGEQQFNDLGAGVTVQMDVRDLLSGLVVTGTAAVNGQLSPTGSFSIIYSTTAGAAWAISDNSPSYNGSQEGIFSLAAYKGRLYAGQGTGAGDGDVNYFTGNSWVSSYLGAENAIYCMAVYNGLLYAGQGYGAGDGDVLVHDGVTWNISHNGLQERIHSLAVYDGKLYAGQGDSTGDGDVLVFDGSTWKLSYDGVQESINSLAVYDGRLYAGQGTSAGDGDVLVYDGVEWKQIYDGAQEAIFSMAVYDGKLYAGQGLDTGDGDVLAFDGSSWAVSWDGPQESIYSLASWNGMLFAGQGNSAGDGDIYSLVGGTWTIAYNGSGQSIQSLTHLNGRLYVGTGGSFSGDGDVIYLTPALRSSLTGPDGSTAFEVAAATISLALSTNTETCGGVAPCGATNQVRMFFTDLAGNVAEVGPYAVLFKSTPSADAVAPARSTGTWYNSNPFTFSSDFQRAVMYRYVWDASPSRVWDYSEAQWTSGQLSLDAAEGADQYLHLLPYDVLGASGTPRDIGPFRLDVTSPSASSYGWTSSTGGAMSETQFVSLASGSTFYAQVQDLNSGLSVPGAVGNTGFENGNIPIGYVSGGEAQWYAVFNAGYSGLYAARAGAISDGQNTWLKVQRQFPAGTVSFRYKVSSENNYDFLRFYIDGVEQDAWTGSVDWALASYSIAAGTHTLEWVYSKDSSVSSGYDTAWLDNIAFPGIYPYAETSSDAGATWTAVNDLCPSGGACVSLTGTDGALSQETISLVSPVIKVSTNVETCGGAAPCGATNQVYFNIPDKAGNIRRAGPYAILLTLPPDAADVTIHKAAGVWHNTSSFTFVSMFSAAYNYRYAWDNSDTRVWTETEPVWSPPGALGLAATPGSDWYLHLLPYDVMGSSGTARHMGPFRIEKDSPTISDLRVFSSTGGIFTEGGFVDLASGVTVQITVQDALSGLAVSTSPPLGRWGVMSSKDAGLTWRSESMAVSYSGAQEQIPALAVYGGKLYAGQANGAADGDIYVFNGQNWAKTFDGTNPEYVYSLAAYNGKLYAGFGVNAGDGDIYAFDGNNWVLNYDGAEEAIYALAVYNGKLYAGQGSSAGDGDVLVYDGVSWTVSYNGTEDAILSLAEYDGKLYAGQGSNVADGDVYVFDGRSWTKSFEGAQESINSLAVYNGRLYAGQGFGAGDGDVYVYNGLSWTKSFEGAQEQVLSMAVHNGRLYAGQGTNSAGDGDLYAFDGKSWLQVFDGGQEGVYSLASYNGKLYAGMGNAANGGDVLVFSPFHVSTMTGTDGSASPELMSAILDLRASTNTETCAGAETCGATNQVRFLFTDLAGNVAASGSYAVLVSSTPDAGDIVPHLSTGGWYTGSGVKLASTFYRAAYYRVQPAAGPTYEWTFAEPVWASGDNLVAIPDGDSNYLHLLPYDLADSSGTPRQIGPFWFDNSSPTASGFASYSSTGGALGSGQFNDLALGVTVQLTVEDLTSGLLASSTGAFSWGIPNSRPYSVLYSKDAGATWLTETSSILYSGDYTAVYSLAVYDGKLYAGMGRYNGKGDVLVYDGASWSVSYNGAYDAVYSLASHGGKLYAGMAGSGSGNDDIYVFDGTTWALSFAGSRHSVNAMAVYKDRLYAGMGDTGGGADIMVLDGSSWRLSYDGTAQDVLSLAAHNGKLYAGLGGVTGEGDILVYDGSAWSLSYNGSQSGIYSLATYNGKLYAGQGSGSGVAAVYVLSNDVWTSIGWPASSYIVYSLLAANGKLYATDGYPSNFGTTNNGDVYAYDGSGWTLVHHGKEESALSLAAYKGGVVAGMGHFDTGAGEVVSISPLSVSTMTGTDGTKLVQSLSAVLDLRASTNSYSCEGASPCMATNQVKFLFTDVAGNVRYTRPYSVIVSTTANAGDVTASWSTGTWYSASSVAFSSQFLGAAYYRYALTSSESYEWTYTEPQWLASTSSLSQSVTPLTDNWLHLLPYNVSDSSGIPRDFGPFRHEKDPPAVSGFLSLNSTGGVIVESQFNDLVSGVTVQLTLQDAISGLAVSTYGVAGVRYSRDGGVSWAPHSLELMYSHTAPFPFAMEVFNGKLYLGTSEPGRVMVYDGSSWVSSYYTTPGYVDCLAVHSGRLFAGTTGGDVIVFDGLSWAMSYNGSQEVISSLASYNGKLYAGQGSGNGDGDVLVYDGTSWAVSHNGSADTVFALAVYGNNLYAAFGDDGGEGDVYFFNGASWNLSYDGAGTSIYSLAVHNGILYAGHAGGDVYSFNGSVWNLSLDSPAMAVVSLLSYDGKLYAGMGSNTGLGDIYEFDGQKWQRSFDTSEDSVPALAVYRNELYAAMSNNGRVYRVRLYQYPQLTGANATTAPQTLYSTIDLAASTNTETCGGVSPCGATNQAVFFAHDVAGNLVRAGPYAVLSAPEASASDIIAGFSTGAWVNSTTFTFRSSFLNAAYYRYAWDTSPSRVWAYDEPLWRSSAPLFSAYGSDGTDHYLHILPYNVADASGTPRDLGPFRVDITSPSAYAFFSLSSTGGVIGESQFNDLASGVTVQVTVRDILSGLAVSTGVPYVEGFEAGGIPQGWDSGGDAPWFADGEKWRSGVVAARSGPISLSQTSWLQLTVPNLTGGEISFYNWLDASNSSLRFYMDGVQLWSASFPTWTRDSFSVSPGSHTFKWTYTAGSSGVDANRAWLDEISFLKNGFWAEYSLDAGLTWAYHGGLSLTGASGTTQEQALAGMFVFRASTNTQSCAGAEGCGATNQVRFYCADEAGNVRRAGPYSVLISPAPDAGDVVSARSTSSWYNTSGFAFNSAFSGAAYYRYAWNTSSSYEWTYSEPQWPAGELFLQAGAQGTGHYLHVLPYNIAGSSGAPRSLGPFRFETDPPVLYGFSTISSTGGFLSEGQVNDLVAGVTVQIKVEDAISGLLVSPDGSPGEVPFPAGGFRVSYSLDAGASWVPEPTLLSHQGVTPAVGAMAVYDGKLYAGHGEDWYEDDADVFVYDGNTWSLSFDGTGVAIAALAVYKGKLYAGQHGWYDGDGDIFVFDGASWTLAYDAPYENSVTALAVHGGKLYAGTFYRGDIISFDGTTWKHEFRTDKNMISAFAAYNDRLYAATGGITGGIGEGDVYVKEGDAWGLAYDGDLRGITSLAVYNGRLYAGQSAWSPGDGDVLVHDGNSWGISLQGPYDGVSSLAVYKGRLYAGLGNDNDDNEGDIYSYDGNSWTRAYDGGKVAVRSLAVYDGGLYSGQYGWNEPEGAVFRLSQPAKASISGADGSAGPEYLSAPLNLTASRSSGTCGGAAPCSATCQVKFTAMDRAGNVATLGPFAVITAPPASTADIVPGRSSGSWHNTPVFPFYSSFGSAAYYRYAWDTSPTIAWAGTEPVWAASSATLSFAAAAEGTDYYFHARPYNLFDVAGAGLDLGPFRYERAQPAGEGFASVSSTGGYMSESQTNDLAAGVVVRLKVQDALSGMSVSAAAPHGGDGKVPAGGYSVRYSNDAGGSWFSPSAAQAFLGPGSGISALAVYEGKLYAGQGEDDTEGDGDIYVYDGNNWTLSMNGQKIAITCMTVYKGKLYAGQYGWGYGDAVIYVLDEGQWRVAYNHPLAVSVRDMAVYNGRLYFGLHGWWNGDEGDVYVFDGTKWDKSFDGVTEGVGSLEVYDGKLYAGEGFWDSPGDGNIRVFDGVAWRLAYDGAATTARSMAVYDGKLYVGFSGNSGEGDIYVYDGSGWTLSYDGNGNGIVALAVHGGRLYAGLGEYGLSGEGDVISSDGTSWRIEHEGKYMAVRAFAVYNGDLYFGEDDGVYATASVMRMTPPAAPAMTGTEGSQSQETLTATLNLKSSTNTETCGGAAPCGATNQVIFTYTDTAGNVAVSGPYAIIAAPPLSADDVTPARSTGVWYHTSTFSFVTAQVNAAYYRYAWDNSTGRTWDYSEPVWTGTQLDLTALNSGATWYLHLLPYDSGGSYGPSRDIGPFLYDGIPPAPSSFSTFNSTGGVIAEARFNNLTAGVTAQIEVWEGLSGLSLHYYVPGQDAISAADRGFENGSLPAQFVTGGDAPWVVTGGTVASGNFSARNGDIYNGAQSYMYFTVDTIEGEISFYAKLDSDSADQLQFSIDGVPAYSKGGSVPWTRLAFPVSAGRHTFMWNYIKDLWDSELSDSVWVDQVEFPSTATVQVQYSTSSGNSWVAVQSTVPAVTPYISLTGFDGTLSTQTFKVYNLPLTVSTNAAVCGGAGPCGATNQVRFFAADKAGNLIAAGTYAVLVDTSPTAQVADLSAESVFKSSATLYWTAPADTGPGLAGVTTGWYRIDYATYSGYGFSSATFKAEISTFAAIGAAQRADISPLWPHTTYYAMVFTGERAYNFTSASNLLTIPPEVPTAYCGLKMFDGSAVVTLGCEPEGILNSPLRISRNGVTYGVILVDVADPAASRLKLSTPDGIKAVRKY